MSNMRQEIRSSDWQWRCGRAH